MSWQTVSCLLVAVVVLTNGQTLRHQTCSKDENTAVIQPGSSAMLGGILSLSSRGSDGFGCGEPYGSMQAFEAIRWVLDLLNKKDEFLQTEYLDNTYVPGVTLGMKVVNHCYNIDGAVASIGQVYQGLDGDNEECTKQVDEMVFGIVGGVTSDTSIAMSLALQPLHIPLISYESTAPTLTTSGIYSNFMRTVAPDSLVAEVIIRVMIEIDWKFITVIYDSGTYGQEAFKELHTRMVEADLCLTTGIPVNGIDHSDDNMDKVLNQALVSEATGVVVFGDFATALLQRANGRINDMGKLQWIVANLPVGSTQNFPYLRGVISITSAYRFIVEFEDHWVRLDNKNPSSENPWMKDWYEKHYGCSFNPVGIEKNCDQFEDEADKRRKFQQDQFVEPTVMAIFTYAKALRMAQKDKCTTETACPALVNMDRTEFYENYVKKVDFTFTSEERVPSLASRNVLPYNAAKHLAFTDQGDIKNPSFYIWNYNDIEAGQATGVYSFKTVGTFLNNFLDLNVPRLVMYDNARQTPLSRPPSSLCPMSPCSPCLGLPSDRKYFYEHGDVIVNGVFSLHEQGQSPMSCGPLKSPNQVMYVEAMIYALRSINSDNSILPNIKLGGLGIDDCSSRNIGQSFISDIQRGQVMIHDSQHNMLSPYSIEAYTAAHTSPLTDPLAMMMNHMHHPLVAYRAGSPMLDNQEMYPYFIRSAPFVKEEIRAIILMLKYYHWMQVQAVTSDHPHAVEAIKLFQFMAAKEGICVVAVHNMHDSDEAAAHAVQGLALHQEVPVAVAIMDTDDQHRLLDTLYDYPVVRRNITLIASTGWGKELVVESDLQATAEGVLSISLKHSPLNTFQDYMKTLRVRDHAENPWFMEWFMAAHQCNNAMQNCDTTKTINSGDMFRMMYEVESVINGIKAIAIALDDTLSSYCGNGYTTVCSAYTTDPEHGLKLMENLRKVRFSIEDMPGGVFEFLGSSPSIPFDINFYHNGNYETIGDVTPWTSSVSMLPFKGPDTSKISTMCPQPCIECLYTFNHMEFIHVPGDISFGAMFNVHYAGQGLFSCGDLRIHNGAMYTEVVNFAVNMVNSGSAGASVPNLNGVKLGYVGFDGCSNPTRSQAIINRVSSGSLALGRDMMLPDLLSWLTYDSETTREATLFLQQLGTPVVSPGATAPEFRDLNKFHSLFRTIISDSVIAKGMANFVFNMDWKYVYVLNSPDASNRESASIFREYLKDFGICVLAQYEFVTDGSMEVILSSLVSGESQVVAVFAEPDQHIEEFLKTKDSFLFPKNLEFIANRPWTPFSSEASYRDILANSVFFHSPAPTISEFLNYWNNLDASSSHNPWLPHIYEELFSCDYPGTFSDRTDCRAPFNQMGTSPMYSQDIWTLSTINAVYSLAKGLDLTLKEKCGTAYSGVCSSFLHASDTRERLMHHLDQMTFMDITDIFFDFINRQASRGYTLVRYTSTGATQVEGTLSHGAELTLNDGQTLKARYAGIQSECPNDCQVCQDVDASIQDFSYIPGDMYIVGIFDVHKEGSSPFTCGDLNTKHGVQLLEAFHFALNYVNNGRGIFRDLGIQIGGIGLDMCQSPSRAANLVANLHSGKVTLRKSGTTIDPRTIDAYVATMDTESSIRVADILDELLIPQISYGASGLDLMDPEKYDYFMRSVPADDKMGRAIISYLKKFGYNNIQVIMSFDEIGEPGGAEFERLAEINMVCITKKYLFGKSGDVVSEVDDIVKHITANTRAQVVVLWMKDPLPVLKAVNSVEAAYKDILFVATDKWGFDPASLKRSDLQQLLSAKNLIILDVETADVPGFDEYLSEKTPDNYPENPWFKEVYELYHDGCDWDADTCNKYKTIPRLDNYVQDPYVLYVVNAVFAVAKGIEGAINELCSGSMSGVCNFYDTSGERRQRVLAHMKKVNFVDDTHQPFFITEDGQSDRGFHFYNVTEGNPVFEYENVGSYNDSHFLKLDITYDNNFAALCDPTGTDVSLENCVCDFKPDLPSRYMKKFEGGRGLTLVYVGDIHQEDPTNKYTCGKINTGSDLHKMLAFFYAIERINANVDYTLPDSVRLDGVALDTCTNSLRLGQDVYNILSGNDFCDSDDDEIQVVSPSSIAAFIVDKDKNAIPISTMLSQKGITSISPTATHMALDDPFVHGTFLRTHGSNSETVKVILEVSHQLGWDMIGVVYTDSPSHQMAKETLLAQSRRGNHPTCIGTLASLPLDATDHDAHEALDTLSRQVGVTGVVLFVDPAHFRLLMESSREMGSTGIVWIVPSDWPEVAHDIREFRNELSSSIWIQSKTSILDDYDKWVMGLTLDNHMGIPDDWFEEIYQTVHQCKILDLDDRNSRLYSDLCTGDERLTKELVSHDPAILHVVLSVYAAAHGLHNIPKCLRTNLDVAACLQLQDDKYGLIYEGISNVRFEVPPTIIGENRTFEFAFNRDGNGESGYRITSLTENGHIVELGEYTTSGLDFQIQSYAQTMSFSDGGVPTSRCAPGATCECYGPFDSKYLFTPEDVDNLENVQAGKRYRDPDSNEIIMVVDVPDLEDRFNDAWAIIMLALATLGAVIALGLFVYLLVMYPVRGGTSILGYIVSFGIFLMYIMVIAFIYHASDEVCALRRFGLGLVYAIVYSALLVKLVDCCRVRGKNDAYSAKYSKLGRPMGLFMVTLFLVMIQVMINAEWLILEEPGVERVFYNDIYWPRCTPDDFYDEGLVLSLCYVMALILLAFILGIWTFTLNANHRESRWIFGIIILSIPCWIIWCTVAVIGAYKVRDAAVAVGLLINATFMLLLMPVRKLYLLNKYNKMIEEEDKQMIDGNSDYGSVYGRQYDNQPQLHSGSVRGSSIGYAASQPRGGRQNY